MTPQEFRAIRHRLGLTQAELARLLGYAMPLQISELERKTNPKPVPRHLDLVMEAIDAGFWPRSWPPRKVQDESATDPETGSERAGREPDDAARHADIGGNSLRQHRSSPAA